MIVRVRLGPFSMDFGVEFPEEDKDINLEALDTDNSRRTVQKIEFAAERAVNSANRADQAASRAEAAAALMEQKEKVS